MARHRLDLDPTPDVNVIGISSHVKDYRLCWSLNRHMGFSLTRRSRDIEQVEANRPVHYAAYDHLDLEEGAMLSLVSNHGTGGVLIREHRHTDYFMVVDVEGPWRPQELLEQLRDNEHVLTAYTLDVLALRDAHKLIIPDADRPKDQDSCHHRPGQRQA